MMWTWKSEWPSLLLLTLMFALLAFSWSAAPDQIPVHWNSRGEIDRYGTRFEGLALLPIVGAVLSILLGGMATAAWVSYIAWRDDPARTR